MHLEHILMEGQPKREERGEEMEGYDNIALHYLMWKSYKASCRQQVHFIASSITTLSLLIVFFLPLQDSPNWSYRMWQEEEH